jgi:acyl-CoA hydrolase
MPDLPAKAVCESISEYFELALPSDANVLGNLLGGKIMHLVDMAGAIAAVRHCRAPVVTASIDHMDFIHPVRIGQMIHLRSSVNRAFRTSMEVGVKVWVEDLLTGTEKHVSSAYLTFVAVTREGGRVPVPQVIPETAEEQRRFQQAGLRREYRLTHKKR